MGTVDQLLNFSPFELDDKNKNALFPAAMQEAFKHHYQNNELFRNYCLKQGFSLDRDITNLAEYPYLPVNIFKNRRLASVPTEEIKATLSSSATSGTPSTILIDAITSKRQTVASAKVMADYLGHHRRPFLILDDDPSKSRSVEISARSAATRGFLMLANSVEYFLRDNQGLLSLYIEKLKKHLENYEKHQQEVCIFGFTYILYNKVIKMLKNKNISFNLSKNSKVVHIGGWKKLEDQKVSKELFLEDIQATLCVKIQNIFDFYGFTEQMGLVYANSANSPKVVPIYSEIIIRDFQSLEPTEDGELGLIQILTPLPNSYPGISVLTDDVGRIVGHGKDCAGRWGTQFEVIGRAKKAEARGCGDIMAELIR